MCLVAAVSDPQGRRRHPVSGQLVNAGGVAGPEVGEEDPATLGSLEPEAGRFQASASSLVLSPLHSNPAVVGEPEEAREILDKVDADCQEHLRPAPGLTLDRGQDQAGSIAHRPERGNARLVAVYLE